MSKTKIICFKFTGPLLAELSIFSGRTGSLAPPGGLFAARGRGQPVVAGSSINLQYKSDLDANDSDQEFESRYCSFVHC